MSERESEVSPASRIALVEEVSAVIVGAATPCGSRPATPASRSPTSWRARWMSVPARKVAVTTDTPWIAFDRRPARPGRPLTAPSTAWVTSTSTCSGLRPGASVCTVTLGGANSGKTSYLAEVRAARP